MANSLKYQGFDNINEGQLSKQSKKSVPKVDPRSNGDPAGIRTPDPLLKRQLLCRLSYRIGYIDNVCDERGRGWDGWTRTSG